MCKKTLLNSTNSTSLTESRDSGSRELVESVGLSNKLYYPESLQNQGEVRIVESSRVSSGTGEEAKNPKIVIPEKDISEYLLTEEILEVK